MSPCSTRAASAGTFTITGRPSTIPPLTGNPSNTLVMTAPVAQRSAGLDDIAAQAAINVVYEIPEAIQHVESKFARRDGKAEHSLDLYHQFQCLNRVEAQVSEQRTTVPQLFGIDIDAHVLGAGEDFNQLLPNAFTIHLSHSTLQND